MNHHTILLVQPGKNASSCHYIQHDNVGFVLDELVKLYERRLKELNPSVPNITYDINDLNNYIDALPDIGVLVFSPSLKAYVPHDRVWIKSKVYAHLQRQVA